MASSDDRPDLSGFTPTVPPGSNMTSVRTPEELNAALEKAGTPAAKQLQEALKLHDKDKKKAKKEEPSTTTTTKRAPVGEPYVAPSQLAATLDGPGLLAEAAKRKERANALFARELYDPAMQSYLTALWFLKIVRPAYAEVLSGQVPPSDVEATPFLGEGAAPPVATDTSEADAAAAEDRREQRIMLAIGCLVGVWIAGLALAIMNVLGMPFRQAVSIIATLIVGGAGVYAFVRHRASQREAAVAAAKAAEPVTDAPTVLTSDEANALRLALHLNVAACALKRDDWHLARAAAEHALTTSPAHPKALYRLAQAHEGGGDLAAAQRTLVGLVAADKENRAARTLLQQVQQRRQAEKAMFAGVCNKKGFHQPAAEVAAAAERDAREKRLKPKSPLDQRFDAYAPANLAIPVACMRPRVLPVDLPHACLCVLLMISPACMPMCASHDLSHASMHARAGTRSTNGSARSASSGSIWGRGRRPRRSARTTWSSSSALTAAGWRRCETARSRLRARSSRAR